MAPVDAIPPLDPPQAREMGLGQLRGVQLLASKYEAVFRLAPHAVNLTRLDDMKILDVNDGFLQITGYSLDETIGKTVLELGLWVDPDAHQALGSLLIEKGGFTDFEGSLRMKDGRVIVGLMSGRIVDVDGTPCAITVVRDITEQKRTEEELHRLNRALQESETTYRGIFNAVAEGIYVQDRDGKFLDVNEGVSAMYGIPRDKFIGQTPEIVTAPGMNDLPEVQEKLRRAFNGEPQQFEFWGRRANGVVFPKEVKLYPGSYFGREVVIALSMDITERKRGEATVRQATEQNKATANMLRLMCDNVPDLIWAKDNEGRILFVNKATCDILLHARDTTEPIGKSDLFFAKRENAAHPERADWFTFGALCQDSDAAVMKSMKPQRSDEYGNVRGEFLYLDVYKAPFLDEQGQLLGTVGSARVVTREKQIEAELQRERDLFLAGPVVVFQWRPCEGWPVSYVSQNVAELLGYTADEITAPGFRYATLVHPGDVARVGEEVAQYIQNGAPHWQHSYRVVTKLGEVRWLSDHSVPERDADGRLVAIHGYVFDRTDLHQAEEARIALDRQLLHAQKLESLGILAGGIAHDFNNLLTAMLGNLNLAEMNLAENSPALPYLATIEKTVMKASDLTKQMLAYSGKGRFVVMPHDLNTVVQEMLHLLQVSITKKVSLQLDLAPDLPAFQADVSQIQQVVMNLVTNASDAMGDSEGTISIGTRRMDLDSNSISGAFPNQTLAPGPYVVLEVSDNGCGMDPEIQAKIFDPFFTTKVSGRGLGLSAMLGIIRGHQGGILIQSERGKGSSFQLYFPACGGVPTVRTKVDSDYQGQFTGTVLLVDDEEAVLNAMGSALKLFGFQVLTAGDGIDALEIFNAEAGKLKIVLMDITMPRLDGARTFLAMQKSHPEIPVILSSGYDEHDFSEAFQFKGLAAFLQKPYQLKELRKVLYHVLGTDV
ncbi:MAG: PAS domain S-box protein [Holophagaceae bacterium]|nr:PAS domain S-box protein [Holophagaceae bacterium]